MNQVWEWITGGISRLIDAIKLAAGAIVGRVLGWFGLSIVTFNSVLPSLKAYVSSYVAMLPQWAVDFLSAIGIDTFMAMILSALTFAIGSKVFIVPTSVAQQLNGGGNSP